MVTPCDSNAGHPDQESVLSVNSQFSLKITIYHLFLLRIERGDSQVTGLFFRDFTYSFLKSLIDAL